MKQNVGKVDQWIRIILGLAVLSLLILLPGNARWWGILGLIPLLTGIFRFCPLYLPFGIHTNGKQEGDK
ncbi:MAG: DUF2892 domain-containing protein [Clostridia bacterium]|nr:DUF2892 domain-containing protein [Clostridia bacterium]